MSPCVALEVAMMQFNEQKQDYVNSLSNLEENTAEYKQVLSECHLRGAERCVQACLEETLISNQRSE